MRRLHLFLTTAAMGCGAILSAPASAFGPSDMPRGHLFQEARIVCDVFDRCFRVGPYGRRVFLPRDEVGPGRGFGPGRGRFDGPDDGFGPPPGRGRPGFGDDGDRDRAVRRGGDDRDGPDGGPRRRRDNPGFGNGPDGRQGDDRFDGRKPGFGDDGARRPRQDRDDQADADRRNGRSDEDRPRRRAGGAGQGDRGGNPRMPEEDGEQ